MVVVYFHVCQPLIDKLQTYNSPDAATGVHFLVWKKISHIFSAFKSFVLSSVVASEEWFFSLQQISWKSGFCAVKMAHCAVRA